jgi:hypothetical protein
MSNEHRDIQNVVTSEQILTIGEIGLVDSVPSTLPEIYEIQCNHIEGEQTERRKHAMEGVPQV